MGKAATAKNRGWIAPSPDRDKRRNIVLLRSLLLVAVGGLLIVSGPDSGGPYALVLLLGFVVSNGLLMAAPLRLVSSVGFDLLVGAADIFLVALGIHLAGAANGILPVTCLLMVLVVALGSYRAHAVAGAAAVGALHAWLVLSPSTGLGAGGQLALQIVFLCSVALYYGYLVRGINRSRRRKEDDLLLRTELTTLLDILDAVTSTLDLREVTRTIVEKVSEVIPAVRCSILFIDEARTKCLVMASHDNPDLDVLEVDLVKYPEISEAIESKSVVLIQDVSRDPRMDRVRDALQDLNFNSIMVVPLTFGDDVLGTLCMKTARSECLFSESEIKFCTAVARASANALKNAILHRQVAEESSRHRTTGEKLTSILDHSPDLIISTDNEGRLTEFNRGAEKLLGHRKLDLLGTSCEILFVDARDRDLVRRVQESDGLSNLACRLKKCDGSEVDVELNTAVLRDESGVVSGTVWLGRDVTKLKAAQTQLLQAKKLSTIGEVISGVAHELNNPLSGVLGYSQLLLSRNAGGPQARELEKINESALRCQKIVKNLLSFARGHKPERKYLGVNGILEKTLDLRKYQLLVNNIQVETELDPELPCTMLDFHQIQQVLLNLINNAQQAMAPIRDRELRLSVRTALVDGRIRIEIADNGEGMRQETLERIFDPFFTTKEQGEGTGLGLSVSYGLVKEHGGRIFAKSRLGEGTTFVIELPVRGGLATAGQLAAGKGSGSGSATTSGGYVLVVDDEPMILDLLVEILVEGGHRVDTAANGQEACRKVEVQPYDMVITDVRMPQMSGIDLYRHVLTVRPDLKDKVIFITGDLIDRETVGFLAEINAKTIPKPLDIPEVLQAVREKLEQTRGEPVPAGG